MQKDYTNYNPRKAAMEEARALLTQAASAAMAEGLLPQVELPDFIVEVPGDPKNGDLASNLAMAGARAFRKAPRAIAEAIAACTLPGLEMTGLFQHFSVADDTAEENIAYTAEQHRLFVQACSALTAAGHEPDIVHCDNSAGVMLHPDWPEGLPRAHCMARPGIILYGFDPSDEVRFGLFRPVMKLKTVVSMVKVLQPGQSTSYGRRFTAERPTPVATLCTGYADGYPRQLSCGKGIVEIHGTPCPVLGRVCMDQMMVDLSAVPGTVQEGDEAILWGGTVSDSAEDIARKTDTITYEVLCGVSRRVTRVYLEHGTTAAVEDWILND